MNQLTELNPNVAIVSASSDGALFTTSMAIASGTFVQHKNVIELLRTYADDFAELGRVAFETLPFETPGGTQMREVAMLNEDQATLLITYMRNSEIVRKFKMALVKAFRDAKGRAQFQVPTTLSGALRLAAEQAETIEAQALQIAAAAPAVEFVDNYVASTSGAQGFRQVCKTLKANEARFREFLLAEKIMYRLGGALMPMANHLDTGRFEVKAGTANETGHAYSAAKFTAKGVTWIAGEWAKFNLSKGMP